MSTDSDFETETDDPTVYEPRYTMEHVYLDTHVRSIAAIDRENEEYDDCPGDVVADYMSNVGEWLGACR